MNSMFVPGAWWPVSTTTFAFGPAVDALDVGGSPVGHVHRVERRLEELVLEEHPLVRPEPGVDGGECLGEPILAGADVVLARVVRPVREPQLEVPRAGRVHDVDAGEEVVQRLAAHARIRVAHAAEHVVVVLEDVRVDRAQADAEVGRVTRQVGVVVDAIPRDVERDARRDPGEAVDLCRVGDLLVRVARDALLGEDLEAGPGVAEGPRRELDPLGSQRRDDGLVSDGLVADHVCLRRPAGRVSPVMPVRLDRTRPLCEVSDPTGGWRKGHRRRWRPVVRRSGRGNQDSFKTCLAAPPEAIVLTMADRLPQVSIDFNYLS